MERLKERFHQYLWSLQDDLTGMLGRLDPHIVMTEDLWERRDAKGDPGGGGRTRAFKGDIFEKAGVNTSKVYGAVSLDFSKKLGGENLWATGVSLILHPFSPMIPSVHANFRMLQTEDRYWVGGGVDLTPYYPYEEDFSYFHKVWKKFCAPYGTYNQWKKNCDEYFVNHHRDGEMRGIGGIFF